MRLLMAALLAAVVSLGGTLLFSEYFSSIEVRDELQGEPTRKRKPDTRTKEECEYPADSECGQQSWPRRGGQYCDGGGIEDYAPPRIVARVSPSWPADVPTDVPEHTVTVNYCVSSDGRAIEISASGEPTQRFNKVTERALGKWTFAPAQSALEPIQVCGCQLYFGFDSDS